MSLGRKTGGRTKGTPNRRTADVVGKLAALGCDPIDGMARIAMDEENAVELRARMYAELAGYVAPKRKAIDHSSKDGSINEPLEIMVKVVRPPLQAD
jgi:hypothetical protein